MIRDFWSPAMQTSRADQTDLEALLAYLSAPTINMILLNKSSGVGIALWHLESIKRAFLALQILIKETHNDVYICHGDHANRHTNDGRSYRVRNQPGRMLAPQDDYQYYGPGSCKGRIRVHIESDGEYGEYRYPIAEDESDNTHNCTEMLMLNEGDWDGEFWGEYHERRRLYRLLRQTLGEEMNQWL